jgi:hypothetical protein
MKRILIFNCWLLLCPMLLQAQEAAPDSAKSPWVTHLVGGFQMTQVAFKDWAQGGENAMAWIANLDGQADYKGGISDWSTVYKFAFGQTRISDKGLRKIDDKIDVSSVYTYRMGVYVNPFVSGTLKSQFATGRKYKNDDTSIKVSRFFDPAYLTQAFGVGYQPIPQLKTRLGIGIREVITSSYRQYSDDTDTLDKRERLKVDGGIEPVVSLEWPINEDFFFSTKVEMFFAFKDMGNASLRTDHSLTAKVNKYISTSIHVQVIRDKTAGPGTQLKEALTFGLSYTFM